VPWFEREVVGALVATPDPAVRSSVEAFVDGLLRDKPAHLRLGVATESILLGAYATARRTLGRLSGDRALRSSSRAGKPAASAWCGNTSEP
jgi:hypothetical protein